MTVREAYHLTEAVALWNEERMILKALARGAHLIEIARALRCSAMTVRRRLEVLDQQFGLAESDGTGWRLTDAGREAIGDRVPA